MDRFIGDEIRQILHSGGVQDEGIVMDRYVIVLRSGRAIELTTAGVRPAATEGLFPDPAFDSYIGARIEAIESVEYRPTPGLRLNNGDVLVMGAPHPYYWGLEALDGSSDD